MRLAAVDHGGALDAALDGLQAGRHLGDHPRREAGQDLAQRLRGDLADDVGAVGPVPVQPLHVGEHEHLLGPERDGQGRRRGVGVDVVDLARRVGRDGGDDRDPAGVDEVLHGLRAHVGDLADEADVGLDAVDHRTGGRRGEQTGVLAGEADREGAVPVEQADELTSDLAREDHAHDVDGLRRGDPQATAELGLDAEPVEHGADLRSAAVDDDRLEAGEAQEHDVLRERLLQGLVGHGVAAVLHDHDLAVVALQPRQGAGEGGGLLGVLLPLLAAVAGLGRGLVGLGGLGCRHGGPQEE